MSHSYDHLSDADLQVLIDVQRRNLGLLEAQAAKFGSLLLPLPLANEIGNIQHELVLLHCQLRQRGAAPAGGGPDRRAAYRLVFDRFQAAQLAIRRGCGQEELHQLALELNTSILRHALELDAGDMALVSRCLKALLYLRRQLERAGEERRLRDYAVTTPLDAMAKTTDPLVNRALANAAGLCDELLGRFRAAGGP
ncbi:MAG TPA: hypothetical protein VD886_21305 [Herpetosiphonaceae bacterium]|nr:hypothetical protein [Herpetosiphonaceae bacterium]